MPLEVEIGITSALGRRYFELIHKLDQIMPLLQTLEIEEVINEQQAERQRSNFKRIVLAMSSTARNFSMGVRRRMNEADAKKGEGEDKRSRPGPERVGQDADAPTGQGDHDSGAEGEPPQEGARHQDVSAPADRELAIDIDRTADATS